MKQFEAGAEYRVNGGRAVKVEKRTRCYVTLTGDYSGRLKIMCFAENGLFGLGENIWIPAGKVCGFKKPCFAANRIKEGKNE